MSCVTRTTEGEQQYLLGGEYAVERWSEGAEKAFPEVGRADISRQNSEFLAIACPCLLPSFPALLTLVIRLLTYSFLPSSSMCETSCKIMQLTPQMPPPPAVSVRVGLRRVRTVQF
jgi:hypothetical protein